MKKEECTVIHLIWNDSSNLIFWFEDVALVAGLLFLSTIHIQIHTHLKWGGYGYKIIIH
jgi:hypothetical protein